jgi:chemotaxis protein MotA
MGRATGQDGRPFAYALEFPMDIMTSIGLVSGIIVVAVMVFLGGDLHMFFSEHAVIIIFGGSIAATMIRFPLSAILHGLPLGAKFAFTMSRSSPRESATSPTATILNSSATISNGIAIIF